MAHCYIVFQQTEDGGTITVDVGKTRADAEWIIDREVEEAIEGMEDTPEYRAALRKEYAVEERELIHRRRD